MVPAKPLIAIAAVLFAGCATTSQEAEPAQTPATGTEDLASLSVPDMIGSPELCETSTSLHLPNAAWASWFADIAYSDIPLTARKLEKYGFGFVGEADKYIGEYAAYLVAKIAGKPEAAAMNEALRAKIHVDRGLEFLSVGSTQLTWANHRATSLTVLAIRGTYALDDALLDANAWLVPGPLAGKVHQGFLQAEREIEAILDQKLATLPEDQTIIVTGHSAGATVGTLWVAHQLEKGSKRHFIIDSFGSPRVGDPTFVDAFDAKTKERGIPNFRFHYGNDPIPTQPNEFLGYKHGGTPVHLLADAMEIGDTYVISGIGNISDHAKANYFNVVTQRLLWQTPAYGISGGGSDFAGATAASLSVCR